MINKSYLDGMIAKVQSKFLKEQPKKVASVKGRDKAIERLWMNEDHADIEEKPVDKKDSRIDTGILRDRIAEKIAKMSNH